MFLRKVKLVMTAAAVVAALAAGAVGLAQSGIGRSKDGTGKPQHVGSPGWTYHILASRNGEPPRKVAVVEITSDTPIRVDAPGALILIQPKRDGAPDRQTAAEIHDREHRRIVLTSLKAMDVLITQPYVCQIHAHRHIDVCALENGYLNEIRVKEGQAVKKGDLMFKILPILNGANLDAKPANVIAPFDGILDRFHEQLGSLVKEGDILTTLSDNSVMWVYFNVPDQQYFEYMAARKEREKEDRIELLLPNQKTFPQPGKIGAIADPIQQRNFAFRADFANPDGLLRHGQTGTILIHRKLHDAIVIPMEATYEILDKWYVYVVDKDDVAHGREIVVQNEMDDIFVIKKGVGVGDRIVLEGLRQVRDGEKVEYAFRRPEEVMRKLKNHAE
jgi:membrane fusion protein, multidrug efflux system